MSSQEVAFDIFGKAADLVKEFASGDRNHFAIKGKALDFEAKSFMNQGKYCTRGTYALGENGALISDGLFTTFMTGIQEERIGVHANGPEIVHGSLEVEENTLLKGFLTVEEATVIAKELTVGGEATFEAIIYCLAGAEFKGKVTFHDEEDHQGDATFNGTIVTVEGKDIIDSKLGKITIKDYIKGVVMTEMIGMGASGPVALIPKPGGSA